MACMGCGLGGLCAVIFVWTFQPGLVTVSATVTAGIAYAAFSIFAIYAAYRAGIRNDEKAQEGLKSLRMYTGDTYTLDPAKSADYLIIPDSWRDEL